jgi:predicted nucleic acid-binding protein
MRVVNDTSPISNFAIIGRLDFLRQRCGEVRIPETVAKELACLTRIEARQSFEAAMRDGWITRWDDPPGHLSLVDRAFLGLGETSAINLALETQADLLLMDEKKAAKWRVVMA